MQVKEWYCNSLERISVNRLTTIHPALVNYSTEDFVSDGFAYTMLSLTLIIETYISTRVQAGAS